MLTDEKQLAQAIMRGDSLIIIDGYLYSCVEKIKNPSSVVWSSVFAAIIASAFFWGSPVAILFGISIGLPAVLAVCGGVGGVVFVTLGAKGTLCAFRMLIVTQTADVLNKLRDEYEMEETKDEEGRFVSASLIHK